MDFPLKMSSDVVCIESDPDDDVCIIPISQDSTGEVIVIEESEMQPSNCLLDPLEPDPKPSTSSVAPVPARSTVKRVTPTLISSTVTSPTKKREFGKDDSAQKTKRRPKVPKGDFGSFKRTRIMKLSDNALDLDGNSDEEQHHAQAQKPIAALATEEKITKEFKKLIQTCKSVDSSVDMEKCIRKKLVGYYREVPPDFVTSKSFRELVSTVVDEIKKSPHLIYLKLNLIVDELKPRRTIVSVKQEVVEGTESLNGGGGQGVSEEKNTKKAAQIKKLNKALVQLKKRIDELDQEEVDWDEDMNTAHMKVERYKKRACQIYEKLCDISGESKHAQRSVRKPIKFHGTVYPEFNKTLQAFVNRTNIFPDYFDVKKCLEHCNKQYNMKLRPEEIKAIAQDAFVKVGKILQKRRKIDLYEMISYFVGTDADPADEDSDLQEKLGQNKQHHSKISDLIDQFADEQGVKGDDHSADGEEEGDHVKFDPMSMVEADMSGDEDLLNKSLDLFAEAEQNMESKSGESDIVDVEPVKVEIDSPPAEDVLLGVTAASNPPTPPPDQTMPDLQDTVNMDEAIEYMVSNSIDPYRIPEMDLLQEFPMSTD